MNINLKSLTIFENEPVIKAISVIDKSPIRTALVIDYESRLLGTLTDGDIRRGLMHGYSLESKAVKFIKKTFLFARWNEPLPSFISASLDKEGVNCIPILDENGIIKELLLDKTKIAQENLENTVIIMAGGKGKRLHPYTENCPKPMITVNGKHMIEIVLDQFISNGFTNFYFSVNYLKEQIINYFGDGSEWNVSISYLEEDKPLGTAGSLSLLSKASSKDILVTNGDILTKVNPRQILDFHVETKADATICVRTYTTTIPFGVVETEGTELSNFTEKPSYNHMVNAGIYVINSKLLSLIPFGEYLDMPDLLRISQSQGFKVAVCPIHEYWLDVGRPETLSEAHQTWDLK